VSIKQDLAELGEQPAAERGRGVSEVSGVEFGVSQGGEPELYI
jgi:hypothetical protein